MVNWNLCWNSEFYSDVSVHDSDESLNSSQKLSGLGLLPVSLTFVLLSYGQLGNMNYEKNSS